jgi:hypothetical protein
MLLKTGLRIQQLSHRFSSKVISGKAKARSLPKWQMGDKGEKKFVFANNEEN